MLIAGLIVELVFQGAGLVPHGRHAKIELASVTWNYTTVLNIVFLLVAVLLLWRYFRRGGGWQMLRMMNKPIDGTDGHGSAGDGTRTRMTRRPPDFKSGASDQFRHPGARRVSPCGKVSP
jgi:hypothetical protein